MELLEHKIGGFDIVVRWEEIWRSGVTWLKSWVSHSLEVVTKYQSSVTGDREREGQGIWNRERMRQQEGLIWRSAAEPRSSRGSKAMFFNSKNNGALALLSRSVLSDSLQHRGLQPASLLCSWEFSRQEYWSGCHALLQGIFPTQGSNPGLLHCRRIFFPSEPQWGAIKMLWGEGRKGDQTSMSKILILLL